MLTESRLKSSTQHNMLIVGAGGHAKVVIEAAFRMGLFPNLILDDDYSLAGKQLFGVDITCTVPHDIDGMFFHVAIGNNSARVQKYTEFVSKLIPLSVIHPAASISQYAVIGLGSMVAAQTAIGPDVSLGECCIVNHGAVIDHDCNIGSFSHIAPNATLTGNVRLGDRVFVGAGATILPGLTIGANCIIGAGAVVLQDLPAGSKVAGVPARLIDKECK